jgi:septum formation protein
MQLAFPVVLATASSWRAELLRATGLSVELHPAPIDEHAVTAPDPVALAVARAIAKAEAVAAARADDNALIIGADQVAHLDGEAFGKPTDPDDHRRRLGLLRGRVHTLSTGVSFRGAPLLRSAGVARSETPVLVWDFVEHTQIHFRADTTDAEIDAYVASQDGSGCAGGYRAEGPGAWLIERTDGDWTNVIGLPVFSVLSRLRMLHRMHRS